MLSETAGAGGRGPIIMVGHKHTDTLADLSDERLIEVYRRGDGRAFAELVERYRVELYHYLMRYTGRAESADDVFQETFLQVHISAGTFDVDRRFRPWLFTIATNKARDYLRKIKKTRSVASLSTSVDEGGQEGRSLVDLMEADWELPAEVLQRRETHQLVQEVVASLPPHLREVLLLSYFHRFSYNQVAEMLQVPLGTVKSRLHTAVGTFAQMWRMRHGHLK